MIYRNKIEKQRLLETLSTRIANELTFKQFITMQAKRQGSSSYESYALATLKVTKSTKLKTLAERMLEVVKTPCLELIQGGAA